MVQEVSQIVLNKIWKHYAFDSIQVEASGRSGGLLSIWRTDVFSLIMSWKRRHWIATVLRKKVVWSQLSNIARKWPGPICLLGDFNSVCFPKERVRETIDHNSINTFNDFIINASLVDQPLFNDEFTWEGPNGKFSRIDRVLVNAIWANFWHGAILQSGPSDRPDHKPIIWGNKCDWGPKPFRFNNLWLAKHAFLAFCEDKWEGYDVVGWAAFTLSKKLRLLKNDIRVWNFSHKDQDELQLKLCDNEIKSLKTCFQSRDLSDVELASLAELKSIKKRLSIRIESKRRLHSRFLWLKLGDKNSRFFHMVSRIRLQSSYISGLNINDSWVDDPGEVKEHAICFF
ncbi:uncharacterized protein [Rutidosis leptorrhynchoides]|uniref:uncharacterized protein n=1 Tax=Rutidosis leptorrhynchoides TaxID=125765 RepID=UPI003A999542